MQQLLFKFNNVCAKLFNLMLDNGSGRAKPVSETNSPGDPSGISTFINGILTTIGDALLNFGEFLLRCLAKIAYFLAKLALNIMDFMNIVIKNLAGQATNYSISGNSNLAENDILFQFLFNELTLKIFRYVLVFSALLLIIFTIMAIVRNEWQNHITGKQNSIKKIFRKVLISIFTTLIVPFILVVGIVFSNVLLSSAMNAITGQSGSFSLGAQLFSASSYDANRYRIYAQEGKKIPIVFDYDGGFENTVTTILPDITESSTEEQDAQINEIINSGNFATGQSAYKMFQSESFYAFNTISDASSYYKIYDGGHLKTKQIEYYAMADFLDFAMLSGGVFYVVNAEKIFDQAIRYIAINDIPDDEEDAEAYNAIVSILSDFVAYDEGNNNILNNAIPTKAEAEAIEAGGVFIDHIGFPVYYNEKRAESLSTSGFRDGVCTYSSIAGSTDEVTGAKYLFCQKLSIGEDGDYLYLPVRLGDKVNEITFTSNFLASAPKTEDGKDIVRNETMFVARGVFSSSGYPTAIREEGATITFYRQDPVSPSKLNYSEIFNYKSSESEGSGTNPLANLVEFFSGVDVSTLMPDVRINLNFLRAFTKSEYTATTLQSGVFTVNYSFVGANLSMPNLYDELSINYVVLIFAVASLFRSLFYIIWGLIQRLYEITLLWITMPGWVAKFPLEGDDNIGGDKTAFSGWKSSMIERVLSLYSIYIALAIVLMLVPVVFNFDFISAFPIDDTNIFAMFNEDVANLVIKTAFVLVLFNFLDIKQDKDASMNAPRLIEKLLIWSKGNPNDGYLTEVGAKTLAEIKNVKNQAKGMFTIKGIAQNVKGLALNTARDVTNAIPGKVIADKASDRLFRRSIDPIINQAQNDLTSRTTTKTTETEIKESTGRLKEAVTDHTNLEAYDTARKDYWRRTPETINGKDKTHIYGEDDARFRKVSGQGGGAKTKVGKTKKRERTVALETRWKYKLNGDRKKK